MNELTAKITEIIGDISQTVSISQDQHEKSFFDLGLDSLDHAAILLQVEDEFGVKIPDEDVDDLITVKGLSLYLQERLTTP